ncbi:MAG TPA: DMT family transporter [Steroidobacteraceae bacterium]|jgi:drug/metabolite transporter (DMT)-like permease|nr:DMT family transporter [Steroidobacteraceae bacterium]
MENSGQLDPRALFYVTIAMLTWSSAYAAIAYALAGFSPGEVAFARMLLGSACFLLWMRIRKLPLPPASAWPALLGLGVLGLSVYHLCLNYAETRIASGTAAIIIALSPAATAAASALWLHERLSARAVVGLLIALAGIVLVVLTSGNTVSFEPKAALVLVSVLATAVYFTMQKPFSARYGVEAVTTVTILGGALGTLPFGLGLPHALLAAPLSRVAALIWLGLAPTFLGYLTWNMALHRASVGKVSSFIYFGTPLALLISWAWLGEQPGWVTLIGGAVVVGGVVLTNTRGRPRPRAATRQVCES